jgi:hypothetical protein
VTLWFGEPWPPDWRERGRAPVCEDETQHVHTPTGDICLGCHTGIKTDDQGVLLPHMRASGHSSLEPWHLRCFLRSVIPPSIPGWWNEEEGTDEEVERHPAVDRGGRDRGTGA